VIFMASAAVFLVASTALSRASSVGIPAMA
jgi:hypothetical protein